MNGIEVGALVGAAGWLALLTLAIVVVVRHLGLLTLRIQAGHVREGDGLLIGERVPPDAVTIIPELDHELRSLVFLSETCGACHEVASRLGEVPDRNQVIAIVVGDDSRMTRKLSARIAPDLSRVEAGVALEVANAFRVQQTPQAVQVENGIIIGKATLRSVEDLNNLMRAYDYSDAREIAVRMREVHEHVNA
jgi:hypothetical protein